MGPVEWLGGGGGHAKGWHRVLCAVRMTQIPSWHAPAQAVQAVPLALFSSGWRPRGGGSVWCVGSHSSLSLYRGRRAERKAVVQRLVILWEFQAALRPGHPMHSRTPAMLGKWLGYGP